MTRRGTTSFAIRSRRLFNGRRTGRGIGRVSFGCIRPGDYVLAYKSKQSGGDDLTERWCLVVAAGTMTNVAGTADPRPRLLLSGPGDLGLFTRSNIHAAYVRRTRGKR